MQQPDIRLADQSHKHKVAAGRADVQASNVVARSAKFVKLGSPERAVATRTGPFSCLQSVETVKSYWRRSIPKTGFASTVEVTKPAGAYARSPDAAAAEAAPADGGDCAVAWPFCLSQPSCCTLCHDMK